MTILRYVFLGLALLIATAVGWRSAGGLRPLRVADLPGLVKRAEAPPSTRPSPPAPSPPVAVSGPAPVANPTPDQARAEIRRDLEEVPQFAAFYKDLASRFPHVYADLVDRAARAVSEGGRAPSSDALIWQALRDLQQSNGILASGADEQALAMFFDARLAMLDVLATVDPRGCADFLYGTTDPSIEIFTLAHRDLVADMAAKQIAAIEDGQHKHLEPARPGADDLDLVANGLTARHLDAAEVAMLLDGKAVDPPLPDTRLCEIGRTYLSVLKNLPSDVRQRVYGFTAELLARS